MLIRIERSGRLVARFCVSVASDEDELREGLRGIVIGPHEGLLMVFPDAQKMSFTMAGVPQDLTIALFDVSGRLTRSFDAEAHRAVAYPSVVPVAYALEVLPCSTLRRGDQLVLLS